MPASIVNFWKPYRNCGLKKKGDETALGCNE